MKKYVAWLLVVLMLVSFGLASAETAPAKTLRVGISYPSIHVPWLVASAESYVKFGEERGYEVILTNADNSADKQLADVEDLISRQCDVIMIYSVDSEAIAPAIDAVKAAGIDCICLLRELEVRTAPDDYLFTMCGDTYQNGVTAATWLENNLPGPKKIVMLTGPMSASDAVMRAEGFIETIDTFADKADFEIVATQNADWNRVEAQKVMQNIIQSTNSDFNVLYAQNNEMALGAIAAMKQVGIVPGKDVTVVAIDASIETVQAIIAGDIACTVSVPPAHGWYVYDLYEQYLAGEEVALRNLFPHGFVDGSNAEEALVDGTAF